tara:strand:+ start:617 stop:970 length:354 start_codon:yes stop_codon:yes gene_type:complete
MGGKGRLIKAGIAKIKKKINSINSTDNMSSSGPIDNAINRGMYNRPLGTYHGKSGAKGDMIPDNLLDRPKAGSRGTLPDTPKTPAQKKAEQDAHDKSIDLMNKASMLQRRKKMKQYS